jgi:hypothetical protein
MQGLELVAPHIQRFPESIDNLEGDQLMREAMDGNGMPQKIIRELPDVERIRAARMEAQQQATAQQQAMIAQESLLKNVDRLNQPVKPGTMLDDLNKQMTKQGAA